MTQEIKKLYSNMAYLKIIKSVFHICRFVILSIFIFFIFTQIIIVCFSPNIKTRRFVTLAKFVTREFCSRAGTVLPRTRRFTCTIALNHFENSIGGWRNAIRYQRRQQTFVHLILGPAELKLAIPMYY